MTDSAPVVVVGAGHGGGALVAALRQYGWKGPIVLVGDEPVPPYQRPPLSKAWLQGEAHLDSLLLKPAGFYAEQRIDLRLGRRVLGIDRRSQRIGLDDGSEIAYGRLVLATGAQARQLTVPGAAASQVMSLRTLADAERLKSQLAPGRRVVIVGGGYVGLECAATARRLGAEVVVLERATRLLERVAGVEVAAFLHRYHTGQGVAIEVGVELAAIEGATAADAVRLRDGRTYPCDLVLVGVGASPCATLASNAGLECADGVVVDADCRTSDPCIYAIGDVARRPHPLYGRPLRLESVPNAQEQARRVASVIAGREPPPAEVPWFWSDQYGLKLQTAGLPGDIDESVLRGDPAQDRFAVFHRRAGRIVNVEAINSAQEFMAGRKWIASGLVIDPARLADTTLPVAQLQKI